MATSVDIAPSTGATTSFLQAGPGASPGYSAIDVRRALGYGSLQEGVIDSGSYMVTQRAAGGVNQSVDVAASTGNGAYVQGDAVTSQGLYYVPPHSALINLDIGAADATNPRVDQIVLRIYDDTHDSSGANKAQVYVVAGTATVGATLDNRTGAAALPTSAIRLADVLIPAASASVSNTNIRDRRPWARGAYKRIVRNANASAGNDYTTSSATPAAVDATNLNPRIECSGSNPIRVTFQALISNATATNEMVVAPYVDGAAVDGGAYTSVRPPTTGGVTVAMSYAVLPAAGSHRIAVYWYSPSATALTMLARATFPVQMTVEELVRQNIGNNETTSG